MAASMDPEKRKLPDLFHEIWKTYEYLDTTEEPTMSDSVQGKVKEGISIAEQAVHMVNELQLFSDNENIEDVKTNELKFLLLPAMLAFFQGKNCREERFEVIKKAQLYHIEFLKLCKKYGVTSVAVPTAIKQNGDGTTQESASRHLPTSPDRQAKIARYKEQKETEQRLKDLYPEVQKEHVDDEVKREYYQKLLKKWVNCSLEELDSIEGELPILEHMARMKQGGKNEDTDQNVRASQPKKPMRPFIITRDSAQKQVYGLGYPSIPTYSLDEFYESQVQQGRLPDRGITAGAAANDPDQEAREKEKSEREKEEKVERDDEETLKNARDWDEWRDDHRRGWGNTHNKG